MKTNKLLNPLPAGAEQIYLPLANMQMAALAWGDPNGKPLFALHGWLDNAMTFINLGPELAQAGYRVIALEFAGHGYSDWRPLGQTYQILDNCFDIQAAAMHLGWEKFTLVGHSMGAGIASIYAGANPQAVEKLVAIDALGTLVTPADEAPSQLNQALTRWIGHQERMRSKDILSSFSGKIYPTIEAAAKARMQGIGKVDYPAALALCQRALRKVDPNNPEAGYFWRSDSRLRHPSPLRLTQEQNLAFMQAIQAASLVVFAEDGLVINLEEVQARVKAMPKANYLELAGGHHLHLETSSSQALSQQVVQFLLNN